MLLFFIYCNENTVVLFDVFSTVHLSRELFHQPTSMHSFLYSLTICSLHYYPRHVSSINMPIFRRKNCIHTASGIFAFCKRLHSTLVQQNMQSESAFNTEAIWLIVFLLPTSSRIHLQRRHASYRCARPLPAKEGTITKFC